LPGDYGKRGTEFGCTAGIYPVYYVRISVQTEKNSGDGILEEFQVEFLDCWQRLPNKVLFFVLFAAWLALFQFLGNATLGYARTHSLFVFLYKALTTGGKLLESEEVVGLVIPVVVLGLFWLKRNELLAIEIKSWWAGLVLVGAGLLLHTLGIVVQQPRVSILALFTGIYGLMGLAWGPAWLRTSSFPFFLFAFCMPLGSFADTLTFPLRLLVTRLVEFVCHYILMIDVIRDGTMLKDPTGRYQYEVAAACSGIRSLITTTVFSFVLAFLSFRTWWKRLAIIAAALPLALFGNLLRMLGIVLAADLFGKAAGDWVHEGGPGGIVALIWYIPGFAGLLLLEHYLRKVPREALPAKPVAPPVEVSAPS
jgi:exosortase